MNSTLAKAGFSSIEQVRREMRAQEPLRPDEVRRALARMVRKGSTGRRGLPDHVVEAMWQDYQRLKSLAKVGALYGRTRQSMFIIFSERGLPLQAKNLHPKILWQDRSFTPGKHGYYRETSGARRPLHHLMWEQVHGPVPVGHQVMFRDGDLLNLQLDNLDCQPIAAVSRHHNQRRQKAHRP